MAPLTGTPALPAIGARFECACVSHVAVDDDRDESHDAGVDPADVLIMLVHEALAIGQAKGVAYVVLGLSARSPLSFSYSSRSAGVTSLGITILTATS